jgi:hypothetical protein
MKTSIKTIKPPFQVLVIVIAAGLMTQLEPFFGAVWEGTDDFSATLANWDTTYVHIGSVS